MRVLREFLNSFKKPKIYNAVLLNGDFDSVELLVEISVVAYSSRHALKNVESVVKEFNHKYSANYKVDKVWQMNLPFTLTLKGGDLKHYKTDLSEVNRNKNLSFMLQEYNFLKNKWLETHSESR